MKKKLFKVLAVAFAAVLSLSVFTACGEKAESNNKPVDNTKTQLYVGVSDGGYGQKWINDLIERFEAVYTDIQVWPTFEKDLFSDTSLYMNMASRSEDLYFVSAITYQNYINSGLLADMTDLVTTPMNESPYVTSDETESIEGKLCDDTLRDYYKTSDEKYYAIPFTHAFFGLVYDVDLFDAKRLYFNQDGTGFITSLDQPRSLGPDGKTGLEGNVDYSADDGLPSNIDQLKTLFDRMVDIGVTPMTWNGKNTNYMERYLMSLWADYEGEYNFNLNNTFEGEYTFAGESNPTPINQSNAYLLQRQKGKAHALEIAKLIASNPDYYSKNALLPSQTHILAQDEFLTSTLTNESIAMLVDATWWENEASGIFSEMADLGGSGYAKGQRRFAFLPTPKAEGASQNTTLLSVSGHSVAMISANTTKLEAAKKFIAFAHTDANLAAFTKETGVIRPFNYEIPQQDLDTMTPFAKSIFNVYNRPDTDVVYNTVYSAPARINMPSYFVDWSWGAELSGGPTKEPIKAFREDKNLTVAQYVEGMVKMYDDWKTVIG